MPKIVITGGPCAGKTTLMGLLAAAFVGRGREVVLVNECATELLAQGITPDSCGSVLAATYLGMLGVEHAELFLGMYAGIYRLLDMAYTSLNVAGDVTATVWIDRWEKKQ